MYDAKGSVVRLSRSDTSGLLEAYLAHLIDVQSTAKEKSDLSQPCFCTG